MDTITVKNSVCSVLPTGEGTFRLMLYEDARDGKEHLVLVKGDVSGRHDVLVRVHSECFTGDVFGSRRCDCGEQLSRSMQAIARERAGVIVYLRQEGRGIGLAEKLRAYNLQDQGYDTVDANLMLGHRADEREYSAAAHILKDLDVRSVRLLTNSPEKLTRLRELGVAVLSRVPVEGSIYPENLNYLLTKIRRMNHELGMPELHGIAGGDEDAAGRASGRMRPFVTLSYAQSLDGSIAGEPGKRLILSGPESLELIHTLRARHDSILIGIGTVLADDPQLTVRYTRGSHPQPVVVDGRLRLPLDAFLLKRHPLPPWIAAGEQADAQRQKTLEQAGARIIRVPAQSNGYLDIQALLGRLYELGIRRLMVEGGARIITSFLSRRLVDRMVITVAPVFVGGMPVLFPGRERMAGLPKLRNLRQKCLGRDLIVQGDPVWEGS